MNKNKFAYLKKEPALPCPGGSPVKDEFQLVTEGNNLMLEKVGEINVQKQIESYRDTVDLGKMIERYKRGDTSALSRGNGGFYADISNINADLAEQIQNQRLAAEYFATAQKSAPQAEKVEKTAVNAPQEVKDE